MKIKDNILHYVLAFAVVLSVCLTSILWVNPTYLQNSTRNDQNTEDKKATSDDASKTRSADIYQPTSVVYNENGHSFRQTSSKLDLINDIREDLKTWDIQSISRVKKMSTQNYEELLKRNHTVLMGFSGDVTATQLKELFKNSPKGFARERFNRIAIQLTAHPRIYLLNDNNYRGTRVMLKKGKFTNLRKMVASENVEQVPIDFKRMNGKYISFYSTKVRVQQYSYLANKDNASTFVTRLLGTSNSSVNSRKEDKKTVYFDNSGQRMTVENDTGEVSYLNYSHNTPKNSSLSNDLTDAFKHLQETGRLLDDVRYDEYDVNDHQVTYRTYINAFPILTDSNYGAYHIKLAGTGGERTDFSLYSLQIPVPAKNNSVELPPTQEAVDKLLQRGIPQQKIKSIRIGYQAEVNGSSKQVIDLIPTYFVLYNGSWVDYQDILDGKVS